MATNLQAIGFLIILLLIAPGCINSQDMGAAKGEIVQETELPEKLNLVADTAGRDIDRGQQMDLLADANGEKTLILWVAAGCSGCHAWTEMIADSMREGNISNDTRIISIHRYPSFESRDQVIGVYASENSSTQSLWPVLIPDEGQSAIDMDTGQNTDSSYSTAFDNPVTPSFTLIDGDGKTLWKSKVYRANQTLLTEAMDLLDL
ncbi:MAG: hypothetical protein HOB52_04475 [Euryarchaeota archaeon]|jgi:hypothetical protein|nr:hypothetical protein [Euryarchaeota archaeon]